MIGETLLHYTVLERLGEGGMGVVYKGRDTELDRLVALKVLPRERVASEEARRRFMQEARAASALNHPNIVTIHHVGSHADQIFIAMEFVAGRSAEIIPRQGLPIGRALKLAVQIADGLATAHRAGLVHRDIKPANIMVTDEGREEPRLRSGKACRTGGCGNGHHACPARSHRRRLDREPDQPAARDRIGRALRDCGAAHGGGRRREKRRVRHVNTTTLT